MPAFAQPYKLILNSTIDAFFCGYPRAEALTWQPLLKRYWNRFTKWIPQIHRLLGALLTRSPPHGNGTDWWRVLTIAFGNLESMTKKIVECLRVTLFGRYRCHLPVLSEQTSA